jgi:hypothetical protein
MKSSSSWNRKLSDLIQVCHLHFGLVCSWVESHQLYQLAPIAGWLISSGAGKTVVEEHSCLYFTKYIFTSLEKPPNICSENGTEFQVHSMSHGTES